MYTCSQNVSSSPEILQSDLMQGSDSGAQRQIHLFASLLLRHTLATLTSELQIFLKIPPLETSIEYLIKHIIVFSLV